MKGRRAAAVDLPAGLKYHCEGCWLVIPMDAPTPPEGTANCAVVVSGKLAWFNSKETRAAQHIMAAAAWCLIHDAALKQAHAASVEYRRRMALDRKALYAESAARKGLTPAEMDAEVKHRRDGWLHAPTSGAARKM